MESVNSPSCFLCGLILFIEVNGLCSRSKPSILENAIRKTFLNLISSCYLKSGKKELLYSIIFSCKIFYYS